MFAKMLSRCLPSKALRPLFSLNPLQKLIFMPCREETCGGKDTAGLECQHTCCATDKKKVQRSQRKIVFNKDCGKAWVDLPVCPDPRCPKPCKNRRGKKKGILYDIKLKILEGGSNFRTPMWRLKCKDPCPPKTKEVKKLPPPPEKKVPATIPKKRKGVQITILGAEQSLGQYIALLLKQCPSIKMIHLYEAEQKEKTCDRDLYKAAADMLMIDTNCNILAYSCTNNELDKSLQSTDIVVVLGSSGPYSNAYNPLINRFYSFAPQMVNYAESISHECPRACVLICATPVELMVPLFAEVMKETGWYDPTKLFGSVAISESRASTLAARSLSLHPLYTRVPCVIGTEGETLVPLFSKSVEYFDFTEQSLFSLTDALRKAPVAVARTECCGLREAELSEAYAIANLVKKISYALLCQDHPRFFSYIDTNCSIDVALMRYLSCEVELNGSGISRYFELPKMNEYEIALADHAITTLEQRMYIMEDWYLKYLSCVTPTEDKLLNKLEENEPELATSPEEECVICVNAKATMQTSPCGHRVVCRRCFVKTIQMAVSQRLLPLRCVICRAKILRLRQAPRLVTSKSWQVSSNSGKSWGVPGSVSSYSVGARSVPASASLYSVTSGESSLSGVSSVSSNSGGVGSGSCSAKLCGGARCGGACLGAVPRAPAPTPPHPRQPASHSLRRSQHHSMKARLQEYQVHSYTGGPAASGEPSGRLPPIREFQREFREGRRESAAAASASTRIRCAQKIVTQLETSPQKTKQHFFRPLKPSNKQDEPPKSRDQSKETERKKENPKTKPKKEDKKKKEEETKQEDKSKEESKDNKKNENAEKKKEEKLRLKAEKEAKKEAKLLAKEEERQAKLLAKEEEKQAKLLAKEEKKKAKKEAKLAAQAEKEKEKNKDK